MSGVELLIAAIIGVGLDFVLGDPVQMPHMVRWAGYFAQRCERTMVNAFGRNALSGVVFWLLMVGGFVATYWILALSFYRVSPWLKTLFDGLVLFQAIAYRDLVKHLLAVKDAFRRGLETARRAVSMIVGRDTDRMEKDDVCRAAIESGAENLSDAIIAPLFWFALLGPVGALGYRISNTLDAMVGHRNDRYEQFGNFSARVDDVLSFVPARLCCLLLLPPREWSGVPSLGPDAREHPSVNAGWPEAAMARRLGVVIGGRMYENGKLVQTAEMNAGARQPTPVDIERTTRFIGSAYAKALVAAMALLAIRAF